ncbi:remorin 4.1 [Amborella trichopoda]|uniref:Remorin C-terminal domain-containing protein n=1 Tax=Amborella trichopoda TaxID=13333 RepID=W1PZ65_AMBTC|nr:remorin 4.1 [Amborella trichopoda]XP_020527550.1 remorin 4.1 [Amborella trichopoda]XP_020527551.1 remorin 4.1 [Amborella trichopoda]XP_020527552.1 remorin 4.1 [Amborella trichopoda]ERN13653.1 hypothetical protein AMTR_s00049p00109000 [Amborella trichopoda]|eukprot:XP_020527549.1 remorin 4.1 [Amborella trichopoda]
MRPLEDKSGNAFEFHKGSNPNRASHQRTVLGSLSKPAPSKWDDAQKWLVGQNQAKPKVRVLIMEDRELGFTHSQKAKDSSSKSEGSVEEQVVNDDEGETKKIDCNESLWRINKTSLEDSASAIRSVCVRDMGTEMTPIGSQEPSRTGTPLRASTPCIRSPISSGSSSPNRSNHGVQAVDGSSLQSLENRRDVMYQGRPSVTGWSSKDGESDASRILCRNSSVCVERHSSLETRALAWDEAERAKYMARYKREEVKIQAWENHQKRKAETEMRRMEARAERLKSRAQERRTNKLAATRRKAEEKRANAEAKLNEQAVRTSERADYIRRTGRIPSFFYFKFCR